MKSVKYRNVLSFFCYFTTIFSAGLVPWYVTLVRIYHLSNTFFALFLPYAVSVFFLFVLRSSFSQLPIEILEAAKIDGAGEMAILLRVVIPLSVTPIITVGFLYALQYWNDWYLTLMFINRRELYPLQFRLYSILTNTEGLSAAQAQSASGYMQVPTETVKMATTVLTIAPILLLYPFVQRYFVQGITIGAVKG
jgi:putative aldouronate transport system permease protein